jgi:hypothetical protein
MRPKDSLAEKNTTHRWAEGQSFGVYIPPKELTLKIWKVQLRSQQNQEQGQEYLRVPLERPHLS